MYVIKYGDLQGNVYQIECKDCRSERLTYMEKVHHPNTWFCDSYMNGKRIRTSTREYGDGANKPWFKGVRPND